MNLYGEEMEEKLGSLEILEKGLLPMGVVGLWKGKRPEGQFDHKSSIPTRTWHREDV